MIMMFPLFHSIVVNIIYQQNTNALEEKVMEDVTCSKAELFI